MTAVERLNLSDARLGSYPATLLLAALLTSTGCQTSTRCDVGCDAGPKSETRWSSDLLLNDERLGVLSGRMSGLDLQLRESERLAPGIASSPRWRRLDEDFREARRQLQLLWGARRLTLTGNGQAPLLDGEVREVGYEEVLQEFERNAPRLQAEFERLQRQALEILLEHRAGGT